MILLSTDNRFGAVSGILLLGGAFAPIYPLVVEKIGHRFPYFHPGFYNGIFSFAIAGGLLAPATLGYFASQWGVSVVMGLPLAGSAVVFVLLAADRSGSPPRNRDEDFARLALSPVWRWPAASAGGSRPNSRHAGGRKSLTARSNIGIHVIDLKTGKPLYARNENRFFLPASNMKLFTTALALLKLGPDYRFETRVIAGAAGDLALVGSGDPSMSGRIYPYSRDAPSGPPLAARSRNWPIRPSPAGLTRVRGDIVGDDRLVSVGALSAQLDPGRCAGRIRRSRQRADRHR